MIGYWKRSLCFGLAVLLAVSCAWLTAGADTLTQTTNLPTLYITLDNGARPEQITKTTQLPGTASLRAEGFEEFTDAPITIKGRGNSTWNLPKKPYQIKFDKKTDVLGMGSAKKWILLANYWDKTLVRNAITYGLANRINRDYSVEYHFVDVYLNGAYQGNYLLTEKIEFGGQRIDEDIDSGGVLMELEEPYRHEPTGGCDAACVTTASGVHALIKEPEIDEEFTVEQMTAVNNTTTARLGEIEAAIKEGYDAYSKMIDVESFIDWYIENELAKNYDAAFVTSSFCYLDSDGVLHMGPVWDVDVCFGNQDVTYPDSTDNGLNEYNYRSDKGAWYLSLFRDETFVKMLKDRWAQIKEEGHLDWMVAEIDRLADELAQSQLLDNQRWPDAMMVTGVRDQGKGTGGTPYFDYQSEIDYLKLWLNKRINWLDSQWNDHYRDLSAYKTAVTLTGDQLQKGSGGSVADGIWSWRYVSSSTSNKRRFTSQPVFAGEIGTGEHTVNLKFKYEACRAQDAVMLRLVGIDDAGQKATLRTTIGTHLTYAASQKDEDGFGNLLLSFDTSKMMFDSYYVEIDAYNANVSVKEITLYSSDSDNTPSKPLPPVEDPVVYGDADENNKVDASDALTMLKASVSKITLTDRQMKAGDVDGNQKPEAADALLILKKTVNKIDKFPVEEK